MTALILKLQYLIFIETLSLDLFISVNLISTHTFYFAIFLPYNLPYFLSYTFPYKCHVFLHNSSHLYPHLPPLAASLLVALPLSLVPRFKALAPPRCLLSHTQSNPLLPSSIHLPSPCLPFCHHTLPQAGQVLQPVSLLIMFLFYLLPTLQLHVITLLLALVLPLPYSLTPSLSICCSLSLCLPLTCCQSLHCKLCGTFHCSTNLFFFFDFFIFKRRTTPAPSAISFLR